MGGNCASYKGSRGLLLPGLFMAGETEHDLNLCWFPLIIMGLAMARAWLPECPKKRAASTSGPYAISAIRFIWFADHSGGFSLAAQSWWIALMTVLIFLIIYLPSCWRKNISATTFSPS